MTIMDRAFHYCTALKRLRVPSSVKSIGVRTFGCCLKLREVELARGLENIETDAFVECTSLESIVIPSSVKSLESFRDCTKLIDMEICNGVRGIGESAFQNCTSLERVRVPSSVQSIGCNSFHSCMQLMYVDLCDGLERIGSRAFEGCNLLQHISIPVSVTNIEGNAFDNCQSLVAIMFCTDVEDLVIELALSDWYDPQFDKDWKQVYLFLMSCKIPKRLGLISTKKWRDDICDMVRRFACVHSDKFRLYCEVITSRLDNYIALKDAASLLELALWKSKIAEQCSDLISENISSIRSKARYNCGATVIIPNVLSFLVDIPSQSIISYCEEGDSFEEMDYLIDADSFYANDFVFDEDNGEMKNDFLLEMYEDDDDEDDDGFDGVVDYRDYEIFPSS